MKPTPDPDQEKIDLIQSVLTDLVKCAVRNPEAVTVSSVIKGPLVAMAVKPDQDDVRRIIGKQGKQIRALETIMTEALKRLGKESHVIIDESPRANIHTTHSQSSMGAYSPKKFKEVKELIRDVFQLFASHPTKVKVATTDIGNTTITEVSVLESDYAAVYGRPMDFDYGVDGHILGSIKRFFDGAGKNNGRVIRIVLKKV